VNPAWRKPPIESGFLLVAVAMQRTPGCRNSVPESGEVSGIPFYFNEGF
jgi:hypothetical protein